MVGSKQRKNTNKEVALIYPGKRNEQRVFKNITPSLIFREIQTQREYGEDLIGVLQEGRREKPLGAYFVGNNSDVLLWMLNKGIRPQLVYMDPPYGTGQDFYFSNKETSKDKRAFSGLAYQDQLTQASFLEFIRERFILVWEILSESGLLFVQMDERYGFEAKIMLDEIFGKDLFINHIARIGSNPKNFSRKAFGSQKDMILIYAKSKAYKWNEETEAYQPEEIERLFPFVDENGKRYTTTPLHAPGETKNGPTGKPWRGLLPPPGRYWRYPPEVLDQLDKQGMIVWSKNGVPRKKIYADEKIKRGKKVQDVWEFKDPPYPRYPTQKNLELLKRIVRTGSDPGDLVLDPFSGSGTTLIAAALLKRRAIGIDNSPKAAQVFLSLLDENPKLRELFFVLDCVSV